MNKIINLFKGTMMILGTVVFLGIGMVSLAMLANALMYAASF